MKTLCKQVLLVSVLLLVVSGIGHAQLVIAPPDPTDLAVPMDILMGLIGKYMVMIQEYQNLNMQGGTPDSSVELRLVVVYASESSSKYSSASLCIAAIASLGLS